MSDEGTGDGFNPCECIWNHELAMRRLLNALRNSQALCTDNECFETGSTPPPRDNAPDNVFFVTFLMAIAMLLYYLSTNRRETEPFTKPGNNSHNRPPTPPSVN